MKSKSKCRRVKQIEECKEQIFDRILLRGELHVAFIWEMGII